VGQLGDDAGGFPAHIPDRARRVAARGVVLVTHEREKKVKTS
jgi:hypothetical protein